MSGISVIIPAYNNGAFIREAIQTVLAQTLSPNEIIVVDDGSVDGTEEVVRSIDDSRLQYHWQPNSGVSVARNTGLDQARGDFVAFLDADDRWRPETLETQFGSLQADPSLICCFGNFVRFENDTGDVLPDQFTFYPELAALNVEATADGQGFLVKGDAFRSIIPFYDFPAFTQVMMFRAAMIGDVRFNPRLIRCQDADFVLRVLLRGSVAFSPNILAEVRRHPGNATRDIGLMALDKLRALESVQEDPRVAPHEEALSRRITRARLDAAGALLVRGRRGEAVRCWVDALRPGRHVLQLAKGTARLCWIAVSTRVSALMN